jgi:type II restriction/modification system DNA methylase subunit YeeA
MTPKQFIEKWRDNPLNERQSYQAHFSDLCSLLGVSPPSPSTIDTYCFERGVTKTGSKHGWADVWKKGYFAFEYKAPGRNLGDALKQLMIYALALDNPPLLVVCDTNIIQIHTHFTNAPSEIHTIALEQIGESQNLDKLRWLFTDPEKFHPKRTITQITEVAAGKFAAIAQSLEARGHPPEIAAHFLNQCLFCLFAEDAELLPGRLFERLLNKSQTDPTKLSMRLAELFNAMRKGGDFALEDIYWFNGGLFEKIEVLPLNTSEIKILYEAAKLNWSAIEPSIFGTLFERGLDPKKRSQLGAHYTDQQSILRIINPVLAEPLAKEWEAAQAKIAAHIAKRKKEGDKAERDAQAAFIAHLERLKTFRVLDPACGSGNFLYLALRTLKDLEHRANLDAEALGLQRQISIECSPANVMGIELNPYAAELARVTVWIGEIQWMLKNGYPIRRNPILQPLDHIENRDAVLNNNGSEPRWPAADVMIGNPPFVGNKKMRRELGDKYTEALRKCYADRVPRGADLVTYWFEKAREQIQTGQCQRAGFVTTQSVRKGSNQKVLGRICNTVRIFNAWSDEEWVNEGAAVRVSLVCFGTLEGSVMLDGLPVESIHADLTAIIGLNLTRAKSLKESVGIAFQGPVKVGPFDIPGELARKWLTLPNPNGRPNSDVLRPWANGQDLTKRPSDTWIIDFGADRIEQEAALYETPFAHVLRQVKPQRDSQNDAGRKLRWWLHGRTGEDLRSAFSRIRRYIATPRVAKHRLFVWVDVSVLPDSRLYAIAREDDVTFGILHSRIHEIWALANASKHGDGDEGGRPTYNAKSCFETFPFPNGLTPNRAPSDFANPVATEIAEAARKLNELRDIWLNPPEWTDWVSTAEEENAGYPPRPVAKLGHEVSLKQRTLTNLYNVRPTWLDNAHKALDTSVANAYGWNDYTWEMSDEEILRRLLALNRARA